MVKKLIAPSIAAVNFIPVLLLLSLFQQTGSENVVKWDLLVFTQSWPMTICQKWKEVNSSHRCAMPSRHNGWIIHGIWPDQRGGITPFYCNRTWIFDIDKIKSIEIPLQEFWKNIRIGTPVYDLWAHEWNKHGTCAAIINPLNTELKYFQQGLSWAQKFAINEFLAANGITPSQEELYPLADINLAIKKKIGVSPMIECYKKNNVDYIVEVRICFDKNLQLTGCEGILKDGFFKNAFYGDFNDDIVSNCDRSKGVTYISELPQPLNVKENLWFAQLYKVMKWVQWFTLYTYIW